jgi:hypothetical protein
MHQVSQPTCLDVVNCRLQDGCCRILPRYVEALYHPICKYVTFLENESAKAYVWHHMRTAVSYLAGTGSLFDTGKGQLQVKDSMITALPTRT